MSKSRRSSHKKKLEEKIDEASKDANQPSPSVTKTLPSIVQQKPTNHDPPVAKKKDRSISPLPLINQNPSTSKTPSPTAKKQEDTKLIGFGENSPNTNEASQKKKERNSWDFKNEPLPLVGSTSTNDQMTVDDLKIPSTSKLSPLPGQVGNKDYSYSEKSSISKAALPRQSSPKFEENQLTAEFEKHVRVQKHRQPVPEIQIENPAEDTTPNTQKVPAKPVRKDRSKSRTSFQNPGPPHEKLPAKKRESRVDQQQPSISKRYPSKGATQKLTEINNKLKAGPPAAANERKSRDVQLEITKSSDRNLLRTQAEPVHKDRSKSRTSFQNPGPSDKKMPAKERQSGVDQQKPSISKRSSSKGATQKSAKLENDNHLGAGPSAAANERKSREVLLQIPKSSAKRPGIPEGSAENLLKTQAQAEPVRKDRSKSRTSFKNPGPSDEKLPVKQRESRVDQQQPSTSQRYHSKGAQRPTKRLENDNHLGAGPPVAANERKSRDVQLQISKGAAQNLLKTQTQAEPVRKDRSKSRTSSQNPGPSNEKLPVKQRESRVDLQKPSISKRSPSRHAENPAKLAIDNNLKDGPSENKLVVENLKVSTKKSPARKRNKTPEPAKPPKASLKPDIKVDKWMEEYTKYFKMFQKKPWKFQVIVPQKAIVTMSKKKKPARKSKLPRASDRKTPSSASIRITNILRQRKRDPRFLTGRYPLHMSAFYNELKKRNLIQMHPTEGRGIQYRGTFYKLKNNLKQLLAENQWFLIEIVNPRKKKTWKLAKEEEKKKDETPRKWLIWRAILFDKRVPSP